MSNDEYWARKFGFLPDPNDAEMQKLMKDYLESPAVASGDKYEQLKALANSDKRLKSVILGRHTMVAANHGYLCTCPSCEIYFASSTNEDDWEDGEFGPFNPEELSKVRELLGYSAIPEKYWTRNARTIPFIEEDSAHSGDRGEL